MKLLNSKAVVCSHLKFAMCMVVLVAVLELCIFVFLKASAAEVVAIKEKTGNSEKIFSEQISISDEFTDIFALYRSFDLMDNVNPDFLMHSIVEKKMEVTERVVALPEKDAVIYKHLLSQMDGFLHVRDSISVLKKSEAIVKADVVRTAEENRNVTRRIKVGRLNYEKK